MQHSTLHLTAVAASLLLATSAGAGVPGVVHFRTPEPISLAIGEETGVQVFTLADVNKDSVPDLIAVELDDELVAVMIGHGDGTFEPPVEYDVDGTPTAVAVADVSSPFGSDTAGDIDGNVDLIVTDDFGEAYIYLGRGDGTFDPPEQDLTEVLEASEIVGIALGDFDHNGRTDLALLDDFDEGVYFLCNQGGTFGVCPTDFVETAGEGALAIAAGDFNGNGELDIAVLNRDSRDVSFFFGIGDGRFVSAAESESALAGGADTPVDLAAGRLDGDAVDDLLIATDEAFDDFTMVGIYGRSQPPYSRKLFAAPFDASALTVADFDGDGRLDALVVTDGSFGASGILHGQDDGEFGSAYPITGVPQIPWHGVKSADLNGDHHPDIVLFGEPNTLQAALFEAPTLCPGDCNQDLMVSIDELVRGVGIALGSIAIDQCSAFDTDGSGMVEINELIAAVANALAGCPT